MKIKIVIASRLSEFDFYNSSATGRSVALNKPSFVDVCLFPNNTKGLPEVYNQVIRESINDPAILVFAHDDLHILDYFWFLKIIEGLTCFDILGLAGNLRRVPRQPAWYFIDTKFTADTPDNLSGVVAHGKIFPPKGVSYFGKPRQKVMLLDGLLLASHSQKLNNNNLFFDEQFQFHFYDLDFCRQAELKNISCGTWDLSLMHESGGGFATESWWSSYNQYINKWGD
jgi:hypothetical protein